MHKKKYPNAYTYDSNGNMTQDNNKQISTITCNHLNLPYRITFTNNRVTALGKAGLGVTVVGITTQAMQDTKSTFSSYVLSESKKQHLKICIMYIKLFNLVSRLQKH